MPQFIDTQPTDVVIPNEDFFVRLRASAPIPFPAAEIQKQLLMQFTPIQGRSYRLNVVLKTGQTDLTISLQAVSQTVDRYWNLAAALADSLGKWLNGLGSGFTVYGTIQGNIFGEVPYGRISVISVSRSAPNIKASTQIPGLANQLPGPQGQAGNFISGFQLPDVSVKTKIGLAAGTVAILAIAIVAYGFGGGLAARV
jgi:hypothetical protein